jgi:predicted RNase H-like HicB family nuclease
VVRSLYREEGGGWLAAIPDLPGCAGTGETEKEALEDVEMALDWWLNQQ